MKDFDPVLIVQYCILVINLLIIRMDLIQLFMMGYLIITGLKLMGEMD